jgi:hypothetical protein
MFGMNARVTSVKSPGARPACRATRGLARAAVAGTTPGRERHANASARTAWEDAIVVMARR